jgi:hypothetical protein
MDYLIYDKNGKIIAAVGCSPEEIEATTESVNGVGFCQTTSPFTEDTYFDGTKIVKMSVKPSVYHVFDYTTKAWVDPRTEETQWDVVRAERNKRLQVTDWTQLSDIPTETRTLWEPYRQSLRDVTNQLDPFNITWAVPPQPTV